MEIEKGRGFVTFSKTEATDRAITDVSLMLSQLVHNCYESFWLLDARKDDKRNSIDSLAGKKAATNWANQWRKLICCLEHSRDESISERKPQGQTGTSRVRRCLWKLMENKVWFQRIGSSNVNTLLWPSQAVIGPQNILLTYENKSVQWECLERM